MVKVFLTGEPLIDNDVLPRAEAEGWAHIARAAKLKSVAIFPLYAGEQPLGAIGVGQSLVEMSESDVTILVTFACQLGVAVARARADLDKQKRVLELEAAYEQQAKLLLTVRELSTPVIPLWDGILALPLVGALDPARSAHVMEVLLHAIQKQRASVVLIDVTGVSTVDTSVANGLLMTANAASLLGSRCILVGISPQVAQTLAHFDVDLGRVETYSDLGAGFARALSLVNLEVRARRGPLGGERRFQ